MANKFIIKSKKDAQYIVDNFNYFADDWFIDHNAITFVDYKSVVTFFKKDGKFYSYYECGNFHDMEPSEIHDVVSFIYKNRKGINERINRDYYEEEKMQKLIKKMNKIYR